MTAKHEEGFWRGVVKAALYVEHTDPVDVLCAMFILGLVLTAVLILAVQICISL